MAEIKNATLTLDIIEATGQVKLTVNYDLLPNAFEWSLGKQGMQFKDHITIHGKDGTTVGPALTLTDPFTDVTYGVSAAAAPELLDRPARSKITSRASLQEDPTAGDADELIARIRVTPLMPTVSTADSPTKTLAG